METLKTSEGIFISLKQGERVIGSLTQLISDNKFKAGIIQGIGAICNVELGYYDLHNKKYIKKLFKEDHQLLGLTGNISWFENNPVIHAHISIGNKKFNAFG